MGIKNFLINYWWMIIIGLILLVFLAFFMGNLQMNKKISREEKLLMKKSNNIINPNKSALITEDDLEDLPVPVKKWLKNVGVIGQERIIKVTFSQKGKMKLNKDQDKWLKPKAKQIVSVDKPGYLWQVDIPMFPLINTRGRDFFYNGEGFMEIRIGSLIPVVDVNNNEKINESSLHRFLMELPWYPTAALEKYITWEEINKKSAKAILSYQGISVESIFYFEEDGKLTKIESLRYKENNEDAKRIPCFGEIREYTTVEGIEIPNLIDVTWIIDQEPFTWYKLENYNINFIRQ